jgi:hypothetical protein
LPEVTDEIKRDTIFKSANNNRFSLTDLKNGSINPPLHASTRKYVMYRKRKTPPQPERNDSESESHHSTIKPYFQQDDPIIEVEE